VHPLFIATIFVLTMASPAVVAVRYATRPKRQLAVVRQPEPIRAVARDGRGVVMNGAAASGKPKLVARAAKAKNIADIADDQQVDSTIQKLILMS
jgi:hypothetical protein